MMLTPLMVSLQKRWYQRFLNDPDPESQAPDAFEEMDSRVIIAGFGRFGQVVGRLLFANKIGVTVLERDPSQISLLRRFGYEVYYGNATQLDLLRAAGAEKAEAIVICSHSPEEVIEIVQLCQRHFPHLKVLARARGRVEAHELMSNGVDAFSRETFLSALDLGRQALINLGMHPYKAQRAEAYFRKLDMAMLHEMLPQHSDDVAALSRAKEARQELEEIFDREMQVDTERHDKWNES